MAALGKSLTGIPRATHAARMASLLVISLVSTLVMASAPGRAERVSEIWRSLGVPGDMNSISANPTDGSVRFAAEGGPVVDSSWPICTYEASKAYPQVAERWAVWWDMRSGWQLWGYDFVTEQEFTIANGSGFVTAPGLEGDLVVFSGKDGEAGVWGARLGPPAAPLGQPTVDLFQISDSGGDCALSGDLVVWCDVPVDPGLFDVSFRSYNLTTEETSVVWQTTGNIGYLDTNGEVIAYMRQPFNEGAQRVCLYDVGTRQETVLQDQGDYVVSPPRVEGSYVAWSVSTVGWGEVYLYDIGAAETAYVGAGRDPSVGADCVVYGRRYPAEEMGIYHYDLATHEVTYLLPTTWYTDRPDTYGNTIVWEDARDSIDGHIYGLTFIPELRADFAALPTAGERPLTVAFTDLSGGDPTAWSWGFGDGATSTQQNPSHEYVAAGKYTVSLTITDSLARSSTETKTDYITVHPPAPAAEFSASPTSGTAPLRVDFTDLSTEGPDTWSWAFGDEGTSAEQDPSHEYAEAGSYTVSLTASNSGGSDTETKADYVIVSPPPPVAGFSASPVSGPAPLAVEFTDLSAHDPASWGWSFGDGTTASGQNPSHEYGSAGHYTVSLTVTNVSGSDSETKADYITVTFPDADGDHWAWEEILACVDAGIVAGYDDGLYHPDWPVTRDQMAVYIARALAGGQDNVPPGPAVATFEDVAVGSWAYDQVEYCCDQNVVQGYTATTYAPTVQVTRDQMAVFVARARGWVGIDDDMTTAPEQFPDVPAGFWSGTAIEACVTNAVVNGYDDGLYHPDWAVTRDQMAVYVQRAFGLGGA